MKLRPAAGASAALLAGRGVTARTGVLVLCAALVAVFGAAVPARFEQIRTLTNLPPGIDADEVRAQLVASGLSPSFYAGYLVAMEVLFALICLGLAAQLLLRRSREPMAMVAGVLLVLLGVGFWNPVAALAGYDDRWRIVGHALGVAAKIALIVFCYLFPDGRFVPRWSRYAAAALAAGFLAEVILIDTPYAVSNWPAPIFLAFLAALLATGVFAQVYRYRTVSTPVERQQAKWVATGVTGALIIFSLVILVGEVMFSLADTGTTGELVGTALITAGMLLVPLSIGVAVLRHGLFDIDLIINRALVYAVLTGGLVLIYAAVVGYLGSLFRTEASLPISLVGAALVAVLFAPLRDLVQRLVNRLMFGERDDPYEVLSRLGQRLEATLAPSEVLPVAVSTVAEALRLPYAAVEVERRSGLEIVATAGEPVADPVRLPLVYAGEPVGRLLLGPRPGESGFGPADRRLLGDLVRQIGVAVHAVGLAEEARTLSEDLQRSREKLVSTREEERRRLRRDLHDGLGPQLASLTMRAEAARDLVGPAPQQATEMLGSLVRSARDAVEDVRRVVDALRPPALDSLGLLEALRAATGDQQVSGLRVEVSTSDDDRLLALPAAVEVAVYHIVLEAVSNAARHASARHCEVRITAGAAALEVVIADDGVGLASPPLGSRAGLGLNSMRERAEELGGRLEVGPGEAGGTRVRAVLPVGLDR